MTKYRYLAAAGEPKAGGCAGQGGDGGGGGVGRGRRGGGGGQPVKHKLAFPHSLRNLSIRNTTSGDFPIGTRPSRLKVLKNLHLHAYCVENTFFSFQ